MQRHVPGSTELPGSDCYGTTQPLLDDGPEVLPYAVHDGSASVPYEGAPQLHSNQAGDRFGVASPDDSPTASASTACDTCQHPSSSSTQDNDGNSSGSGSSYIPPCVCGVTCPAVAALRQELACKDEQVEQLRGQVQRLASFVDGALSSESGSSTAGLQVAALQLKLLERSSELSSSQDALSAAHQQSADLQQKLQAAGEVQAAAQHQAAALKLLLADHLREEGTLLRGLLLQQEQLEEVRGQLSTEQAALAAAQKELAKKVEQCEALEEVLLAANQQVAELQAACPNALTNQQQLDTTKQQLAGSQQALGEAQERAAAAERSAGDMKRQLAVNGEMLAHFTKRATTLEHQVRDLEAKCEQLAAAAAAIASPPGSVASSSGGAGGSASSAASSSPPAAAEAAPMGALARVQALMASREADQVSRLKEEVREKERQVKELQGALTKAEDQVHGLQTVLLTKNTANHRMETELRQVESKLKQQTAAAAADSAALQSALDEAFSAAEDMHQQLAAAEEREATLSKEVLLVRGQLQDVLEALVADVDTMRRQQPEQYSALQAELPALASELGLTPAEEGRPSGDGGDKPLLLGPVLPGLTRKGPTGGLAHLGRLFTRRPSSASTGPEGHGSPWALGSKKGRDSATGNPSSLAMAARASLEWLQQRPAPGRRSFERERSVASNLSAASSCGPGVDLAMSRVGSTAVDGPTAAVIAAAAAAVASAGSPGEGLCAASGEGQPTDSSTQAADPATGSSAADKSSAPSGAPAAPSPSVLAPGVVNAVTAPAASATPAGATAAAGRLPKAVQQRLDTVKALVNKISSSSSKDPSPLGQIAAGPR